MRKVGLLYISLFICILTTKTTLGQIAAWDFAGVGSVTNTTMAATTWNGNLSTTTGVKNITRGACAPWSTASNSWRSQGFKNDGIAVTNADYFQVTLQAAAGYKVSLSTIDAKLGGTSTYYASPGATSQFAYCINDTVSAHFTLLGSPSISTSLTFPTLVCSTVTALQNVPSSSVIYIRYYASGQTTTGGWGFSSASSLGTPGLSIGGTLNASFSSTFTILGIQEPFSQISASPSTEQTYSISGTGETANVTVVPPTGFEISKTTGTGFVNSSGSLVYSAAEVIAGQTLYVRMNAASPGDYSGNITHTSANSEFSPVNQAVSGIYSLKCTLSLTALIQARYNGSTMVPDTVTVELRNGSSYVLVDQCTGVLSASGTGTFKFNSAVNGTGYYIAVKHRNSIETWSASPQSFTSYALSYDFTSAATQASGSNLILRGSEYCIYSGDVNQDGSVNSSDFTSVNSDNSAGGAPPNYHLVNDLNGDGWITGDDFICIDNNKANSVSKKVPYKFYLGSALTSFTQTSTLPSSEQTYNITGAGFISNVTIVPPAGFEISKTTSTGFVNSTGSLVLTASEVIAGKTIYVRMNAGAAGNYSGNITHTSAGSEFTQVSQAVSGTYSVAVLSSNVNLAMGNPSSAVTNISYPHNYLIEKTQFCLSYDKDRGIPNWVAWQVNSTWSNGTAVRKDNYLADGMVPGAWYHVGANDYSGSGFSRGHMCPSADRVNTQSNNDSLFYMTNMVPQNQNNNGGIWATLETYERTLANAGNVVYIYSGGYGSGGTGTSGYKASITTSGGGTIIIPAKLWKVMIVVPTGTGTDVSRVTTSTRTIAVVMDNADPITGDKWYTHRVSVDAVEALTGYDFFSNLSTGIQAVIEANADTGPTQ